MSTSTDQPTPLWEQRFRAARVGLPEWARDAPHRCLYVANTTGTFELYAWDRDADTTRQVTDRAEGTTHGTLHPSGDWVWWFDDTAGDEFGVWRRQPFAGGPDEDAAPGVPAAYPAGLELGSTLTVVGGASDDGTVIHVLDGGEPRVLYASEHDADVQALSRDETLVCLSHSEHGDSRHRALRVLRPDGTVVADLWDGPGKGLDAMGFAPAAGDPRLLVSHERRGRPELLLWDPVTGDQEELDVPVDGDVDADWWPDASALLVVADARARTTLHRHDLAAGTTAPLPLPAGTVSGATVRPDGEVEVSWSSAAEPRRVRTLDGRVVLAPPGPACPPSEPVTDVDAEGPGGTVHALLAVPTDRPAPYATVFILHGGPTHQDSDEFAADRAAYVDAGYAVVSVNYRGSTGYGTAWRDALEGRPGLTELEDVAAVRDRLVADGVTDPARCAATGGSWGGYLTLLALGTQPTAWAVGVASVPVADYVAAYADEMEPLRAFDRSLFGGSPEEVPDRYAASSPITHVGDVRAPVLVLAGANDPRCPIRQIDNYLEQLVALGKEHDVYRYDAGHGSLVVDERVRQMAVELAYVQRHMPA